MSLVKCCFLILVLLAQIRVCDAHQDRILSLNEDKLVGLPEKYLPAEYDATRKKLRVRNHEMVFSPYLSSLFPNDIDYELKITASWYHESNTLPPYINFEIKPLGKDYSYRILLNLETLELLELSIELRESKNSTRWLPIDVSSFKDEIQDSRRMVAPELRVTELKPKPVYIEDPFATKD